ncbi:MAG: 50S ribosome-binding GTPase [Candidatus Nanoarchaeia archaeon]|nr:50S ribosome-binding GTPase [Candidatus Nanoarchaeia archaeon]MDD5239563.1 50S ribosome-binding GTPase [Candidatus Nanoarchaeia archaeon]
MGKYFLDTVKKVIKTVDLIIEVVDARFPMDSRNFELERMITQLNKKFIVVINKADLVPEEFARFAAKRISEEVSCTYISSTERHGTRKLFDAINQLKRGDRVKIGVIGYPNVGKSMIINVLRGKHSAPTGSKPGITKSVQWIRISPDIMLYDTPGVVPLKGKKGAFLRGAIDVIKVQDIEQSVEEMLGEFIKKGVADKVEAKYGMPLTTPDGFLEAFAKKYNLLRKGGVADTERAARRIYHDWITGKIKLWWL